jgi:hypothetical protein
VLSNPDEVVRDLAFAEQIVEGFLQISLLPQRIRTRRGKHLLRSQWSEMSGETLKHIALRILSALRRSFHGLKQRRARLHAPIADEARIAGNELFHGAGGGVTELTASFGYELVTHLVSIFGRARGSTSTGAHARAGQTVHLLCASREWVRLCILLRTFPVRNKR